MAIRKAVIVAPIPNAANVLDQPILRIIATTSLHRLAQLGPTSMSMPLTTHMANT